MLEAHKARLDRDLKGRFGQAACAAEELIAELGAAFLAAEFSFDGDVRHAGYIESWISLLRSDKRAFFTAANKAQAAAGSLHLPVLVGSQPECAEAKSSGCAGRTFDLKAARLTVNQSLERLGGKTAFKPPKTAGSRRTITLPALTVEALSAHRAEQARIGAGELVFSHGGIPWDPDSLTKAFD